MINKNNINKVAELLSFKNYGTELSIRYLIGSRFINEQYPSKELIKTYCGFFKISKERKFSESRLKEIEEGFYKRIKDAIEVKKAFNDKTEITEKVIKNLERFRDEVNAFDEFIPQRYSVILTAIDGTRQVDSKPWQENVKFLDKVNEYIKDKDLSDKELLGIYTKQIPMEIEPTQTELLGSSHDVNLNIEFDES